MPNEKSEAPKYPYPPIGSKQALARMLRCSIEELTRIATTADYRYRERPKINKDGTVRICHDAMRPLKTMQDRIKCMILNKVVFPSYLMGGLAGRDYVRNAKAHVRARWCINEDVSKFFPSASASIVYGIWRFFFHFPSDVAQILTQLTTREGELPQGAKTRTHLANLAFWSSEPHLVAEIRSMGFQYTRFVDDVTISSARPKTREQKNQVMSRLASMLTRNGLRFKRSKEKIASAGQRMEVTGLVLGQRSVGLPKKKRANIRALVHQCETEAKTDPKSAELAVRLRRASALVGQYVRHHRGQGLILKSRLAAVTEKSSPQLKLVEMAT